MIANRDIIASVGIAAFGFVIGDLNYFDII